MRKKRIFTFSKNGQVTAKTAYKIIINNSQDGNTNNNEIRWKSLWKSKSPLGCLFLA